MYYTNLSQGNSMELHTEIKLIQERRNGLANYCNGQGLCIILLNATGVKNNDKIKIFN